MRIKNFKKLVLFGFVLISAVAVAQTELSSVKIEKLISLESRRSPRFSTISYIDTFLNQDGKKIKVMCATNLTGHEITVRLESSQKKNIPDAYMPVESCDRFVEPAIQGLHRGVPLELKLSQPTKDWSGANYYNKIELTKIKK